MNPELEHRLADLADAATRATTGIGPAATLATFRRRRRTRVAATTVATLAAVTGVGLGVSFLNPPELGIPPASPAPSTTPAASPTATETSPSPSPSETPLSVACGLDTGAAFAALSGIPIDSHPPLGTTGVDVYADVDTEAFGTEGVLHVTSFAAYAIEPPAGATAPHEYRAWFLVSDLDGHVVGIAEPWILTDKQEADRETAITLCPGTSWAELSGDEEFVTQIAIVPVDGAPTATLTLGDSMVLHEPEPPGFEGPGNCGMPLYPNGVSESTGAMAGLWIEVVAATLARDGTLTARITVSNSSDAPHTGELTLSSFIVQGGGHDGSVLTPADPLLLEEGVTIAAGGSLDFDLDLAMVPCADDVIPLPGDEYGVEAIVTLSPGGEPLGFSSPTFAVTVD